MSLLLVYLLLLSLVNVKWGKEKFDAVELNTEEPPMVFKAQLFALTGVQPDRQKVMVKGGTLKVTAGIIERVSVCSPQCNCRCVTCFIFIYQDDEWGNIKLKNVSIT